jgi:hypothetical protein
MKLVPAVIKVARPAQNPPSIVIHVIEKVILMMGVNVPLAVIPV